MLFRSAVDAFNRGGFDIILLNMQMPVMDGPEAMQLIRLAEKDGRKPIPIIALTADVIAEHKKGYIAAGANSVVGKPVERLRFRANIYVEGTRAWEEFGWVDREIAIGGVRLKVIDRIGRCAATNVDPATAERDMNLPNALQRAFGHADMGVYAKVIGGGRIAVGDALRND